MNNGIKVRQLDEDFSLPLDMLERIPTAGETGALADLLYFNEGSIKDIVLQNRSFFAVINHEVSDMPTDGTWWTVESNNHSGTIASVKATNVFSGSVFTNAYQNGTWTGWDKFYSENNKPTPRDIDAFKNYGTAYDNYTSVLAAVTDMNTPGDFFATHSGVLYKAEDAPPGEYEVQYIVNTDGRGNNRKTVTAICWNSNK